MKLLLLLAASASAGTVEYVRSVCGTAAGDSGSGTNIAFGHCIDFEVWDGFLCAGNNLFATTGFTGITGNSFDNTVVAKRSRAAPSNSHRVKYSKVDGKLHVDYYEAGDCTGAISTNYAPADIDFATIGGACYSDDSTAQTSFTTAATCCATANTTNAAGQSECLAGKPGGWQWVENDGYYLEECTEAEDGSGCVMVDLAVYERDSGACGAKGPGEGSCYANQGFCSTNVSGTCPDEAPTGEFRNNSSSDCDEEACVGASATWTAPTVLATDSDCGNAACTVHSCNPMQTPGGEVWSGWYATLSFFVFGENYIGQELTVAVRTNDFSAVCDASGRLDLNSHDNAGNTVIDKNSMLNLEKDTCAGNCAALNTAKDACGTQGYPTTWYMTLSDPCSPPGASSSSAAVSTAVAAAVGAAAILV